MSLLNCKSDYVIFSGVLRSHSAERGLVQCPLVKGGGSRHIATGSLLRSNSSSTETPTLLIRLGGSLCVVWLAGLFLPYAITFLQRRGQIFRSIGEGAYRFGNLKGRFEGFLL